MKATPQLKLEICLASRFFDLRNTGIGRFSAEMRDGLAKRGYNLTCLSASSSSNAGYFWYTALALARKLPVECDIYHSLTPMEAIHAPKRSSVVTFHDVIPLLHLDKTETHYARGVGRGVKRAISKHYFGFAARKAAQCSLIACDSEQTRGEVIEHLNVEESKVSVIRLGIARGLEPRPKKDSVFRIGTLSYLDRRKRIDLLIKAFLEADVDGELLIGGGGVERERLMHLAGGDRRIKFAGFVPEDMMAEFYNSLDLFVFPSRIEGYGLPIVEAFACKKPVVVLSDGIIPAELRSRCLVTDNLVEFLKKPGTVPTRDIEDNHQFAGIHDWDRCVEQYLDLYGRVAGARS